MFEIKMEPWESLPDNFEQIRQTLQHISYPLMPQEPEVGKFYRIYPAGCVSGNGTAYHGGVRIGRDAKKLLIYLNGGGVSYDTYSVSRPWNIFTSKIQDTYYSNDGEWLGDDFLHKSLEAERPENPFMDWSGIHLLYCNGDFYCGDGEFPYTAQDGSQRIMPYHGYRNAMATIRLAKQYLPEPETLVLCGSSAGGFGAALLAEDIIAEFPTCKNITICVDSSLLLHKNWSGIAREVWHAPEHICARLTGENLTLDCLMALHQKYQARVKLLFICSVRDALLTVAQNGLNGNGQIYDRTSGDQLFAALCAMCREVIQDIPEIGLYTFTHKMDAPGYDEDELTLHCLLNNEFMYEHSENGKTACEWLWNAVNGTVEQIGLYHL